MVELVEIAVFLGSLLVVFGGAVLGGFLANMFYGFFGYNNLHNRILSLENGIRGSKGVEAKQEKEERMGLAIAEAAAMVKNGSDPATVIKEILPKYPDVALALVKKLQKGGLEGLI